MRVLQFQRFELRAILPMINYGPAPDRDSPLGEICLMHVKTTWEK